MLNSNFGSGVGLSSFMQAFGPWLFLIVLWSFLWKGLALWHAGRRGQLWWFVIILVVNTVGVLEIIYLFFVLKLNVSELFKK
jgi:methionyl-tRNA synthetase